MYAPAWLHRALRWGDQRSCAAAQLTRAWPRRFCQVGAIDLAITRSIVPGFGVDAIAPTVLVGARPQGRLTITRTVVNAKATMP